MKIEYKEGKDKGEENWRISISKDGSNRITIKTENFKWGFYSGEDWDKVYASKNGGDTYQLYVSVITKDPGKLESFKPLIILKFHEILKYNLKNHQGEIKKIESWVDNYKECLASDLFKDILREERLNQIL